MLRHGRGHDRQRNDQQKAHVAPAPMVTGVRRHILFFANWAAYMRARAPHWRRPLLRGQLLAAFTMRAWDRFLLSRTTTNNSSMTRKGHESFGITLSPGAFLEVCLQENTRRMQRDDARLLRPHMVPRLVRLARPLAVHVIAAEP